MKKVRLYNMQSGLEKWMERDRKLKELVEKENLSTPDKYFVVQGTKGVVVSIDFEGVHWVFKDMDAEIPVGLWEQPRKTETSTIYPSAPSYFYHVTVKEVVEDCDYEEYDVKDMVRKFGRRLEINYGLLLQSLEEIGIDLSEYDTNR